MAPQSAALPPHERWAELRRAVHVTQEQMAKRLRVTERTVRRWESGEHPPTGEKGLRYAVLLAKYKQQLDEAGR